MRICFASHNANKVKELNELLDGAFEIIGLHDLGISEEIAETGKTLTENAQIKARYVYERHQIPVFSDDSGLLVDALDGAPGVYSARYAGPEKDDQKNRKLLLDRMKNNSHRAAQFQTIICFIDAQGSETLFEGTVHGQITHHPSGAGGFGYDPIFLPGSASVTFAAMSAEEKNRISHRAQAVHKLITHLKAR